MTPSRLWQDIGAGESAFTRFLRLMFLLLAGAVFCFLAILPLTWPEQAILGVVALAIALFVARWSDSYLVTLMLMMLSMFCTFRYGYWRVQQVVLYLRNPASHWDILDAFFILCLLGAEVYAFGILFLGYFQTIWPLRRAPVPLPENTDDWPHVDVLIPTLNEPLEVVRYTALGALNMDWPTDKLHIYILDDGARKEFEQFAFEAAIGYKCRENNQHAKAGNMNAALVDLTSPLVVVFDCDHVPTRSFLQMTVGWFLRDPKLAMLQTPHHFYSADPFERNLDQFRILPNEGELFYGVVQDGNDFWNASLFCGSCAVLRRAALDEVGGFAVETVTEDAHTSLRMQMNGWSTAYINIPQAAGLATERLSAHVRQRIRWARGMTQVLRTENPLTAPGLSFPQRLCYFNAMCHFLYAAPRLIFLTAPLIYLLLNHTNIPGYWAAILAYALPHLVLLFVTNSRIQGEHRYSFWNEIYETVLSPYILLPTLMALINPRLGKFNVTAKGGLVKRTFFDAKIAKPFLVLLLFNFAGLIAAVPRLLIYDRSRPGTVLINVAWCLFNVVILGVCTAVGREMRQTRTAVRISVVTPVKAKLPDGSTLAGETMNMSSSGSSIRFSEAVNFAAQTAVRLRFAPPAASRDLPATVVACQGQVARVRFEGLTIGEQEVLTMLLYSRADSWLGWGESRESDKVLHSLGTVFRISMHGLRAALGSLFIRENGPDRKQDAFSIARTSAILALAALLGAGTHPSRAQTPVPTPGPGAISRATASAAQPTAAAQSGTEGAPLTPGQFEDRFTLKDVGAPQIELHGIDGKHTISFTVPETEMVRSAKIHVYYIFSPSLLPQLSQLKLILNGSLFATIQPKPSPAASQDGGEAEAEFPVPPNLLAHDNALTVEFIGHYAQDCEDPESTALWARVHRTTYFDLRGDLAPPNNDLKLLPMPFLDQPIRQPANIPVVFPSEPSYRAIQAAAVVASYFGKDSESRALRFPVHVGDILPGNVILIAESASNLPAKLGVSNVSGPTVALRANPVDPYGKVLIVTGADADQTLEAAQALAIESDMLTGAQATVSTLKLPDVRQPDDAPRWAHTDQTIRFWDYARPEQLQGDGTAPLEIHFRIPPDLYFGDRPSVPLKLAYRYNSIPIGPNSSMQASINGVFIDSVPLSPGQESSRSSEQNLAVPVVNLRPFSNTLSMDFAFQMRRESGCKETTPINMQGSILSDSYLDLRGYPHYAPLPNLEVFANAGFPFTRLADLSETAVVLPPTPTAQEIEMLLTLMGHFGRQTGLPALRVSVMGADGLRSGAATDFLVLGTGNDQPAFATLAGNLPVSVGNGQVLVRDVEGFFVPLLHHAWWKISSGVHTESGNLTASGAPDALIEGIESPFAPGGSRSIVTIYLRDANSLEPFMSTFLDVAQTGDISGSVSVLHGAQFQSFRIGSSVYYVGSIPWWLKAQLWFMRYPWMIGAIVIVLALLVAVWIRQWLRIRARARLKMVVT